MSQPSTGSVDTGRDRFEVEVETARGCVRRLKIVVDPNHVASQRRAEGAKLGKTVRIKGFRKGKVPRHVVEERYGPVIDERSLTALVNEGFRAAVTRHALEAVGEPAVEKVDYVPGERLAFEVEVEVMPELDLARTSGFRVRRPPVAVNEEDVDALLESMRADQAVLAAVTRKPEAGDVVSVAIRPVSEDPEAEAEEKPYRFELGAGYAIPDVEAAILTLEPGAEGRFEVRYPDDFGTEALAGSTRTLIVRLVDVRAKRLPELDDDFARQVGDFEDMAALRAVVLDDLRTHREREAEDAVREKLVDEVIDANPFEVPPSLVSRYLDRVVEAPEGADPERVEAARESVRPAVERQIKRDLVLETLIEREGLAATAEELEARLAELGSKQGLSAAEVRRRLRCEKRLETLRRRLAEEKAFEFLLAGSEVS